VDAGDYLAAGDAFAEQGRWSEAQASFEMAMKLAPKASRTWLSYAPACFPQQLFGPAGTAIEDALHYAIPILDTPEIRKGIEAYEGEKSADAQRSFEKALAKGARFGAAPPGGNRIASPGQCERRTQPSRHRQGQ
jgi:tetratricopeptide (TPR) repeat protein